MKNFDFSPFSNDTIAAICTGTGGALCIIRLSGPQALPILKKVWSGKTAPSAENARTMLLGKVAGGETCLAVYMPGPASYTGEDVAELHCHGGNFAPARLLQAVLEAGARPADCGEFTKRAFLNGKMDLTQAEAVMDLIEASSERAGHIAERQMAGCLGNAVREIRTGLIRILSEVESRMDFPEEELDWVPQEKLQEELQDYQNQIQMLVKTAGAGAVIRKGIALVIAGKPNVGKSSLLNRILGFDRAIVSTIPGTTRDTLEETAVIRGTAFRITDTAGLRGTTDDPLEKIGMERSRSMLQTAQLILWLCDASQPQTPTPEELAQIPSGIPVIFCWNKIDRCSEPEKLPPLPSPVMLSARNGAGMEMLFDRMLQEVWKNTDEGSADVAVSERHSKLLKDAAGFVEQAIRELSAPDWELAASVLNQAVMNLGSVTGETVKPDILDEIFSRFCIGK